MTPIYFIEGGTETHEKRLHYKFRDYLYTGREWFRWSQEIIDFFDSATLKDLENLELIKKKIKNLNPLKDTIDLENIPEDFRDIASEFNNLSLRFRDRIKLVCKYFVKTGKEKDYVSLLPSPFSDYISALGPEYIISVGGEKSRIDKAFELLKEKGITTRPDDNWLGEKVKEEVKVGDRKTKSEWKEYLKELYKELNVTKTAKASDLEEWYDIKVVRILNKSTGKRDSGFEILSLKQK